MSCTLLQKWKLTTAIVKHPDIKSAAVEVAVALLNFLNTRTLQCNPSYARVSEMTGLSRDTVIVSVSSLEAIGVIAVDREVKHGERAKPGQNLPSNKFVFDMEWTGEGKVMPASSRKSRPPRQSKTSEIQTTPAGNSDHPQSKSTAIPSRKSRPKYRKEEVGKGEHENRTRAAGADVAVNAATIIFDNGRRYLEKNGVEEKQARSMLGRWRRDFGDDLLLDALREAHRQGVSEPIAFITATLRSRNKAQPTVGSRSASLGIEGA